MGNQNTVMSACGSAGDGGVSLDRSKIGPSQHITENLTIDDIDNYASELRQAISKQFEPAADRYQRYMASLKPDVQALKKSMDSFVDELRIGLMSHKSHPLEYVASECSFKMLDAFVPRAPTGHESGTYYALDFGGTNFRVLRVKMQNGAMNIDVKKSSLGECETNLPKGLMDPKATATMMFDFFAQICEEFLKENGDIHSKELITLGFTFSYPCALRSLDSANLMIWTKGFETGRDTEDPVEGVDVAELMNRALRKRSLPLRVNCVANDTVGTLLSCAYTMDNEKLPGCAVGLILGTGMNACYIEDRAEDWGYKGKIINLECGNFNRDLPRMNVDYELDFADVGGRGRQHLEKMISGAYLGEICRRALVKIFQAKATALMWTPDTFTSSDASTCMGDRSEALIVVGRKVAEKWEAHFTHEELSWIRNVCAVVFERAAALSAVLIAACGLKSGHLQEGLGGISVGIDGSLWKCNPEFRKHVHHYLILLLGEKQASLVHLLDAEDGSGVGAAILAAVASSSS